MKKILLFVAVISMVTIAGLNCGSSSPTEIKYSDPVSLSGVNYSVNDTNEGIYPNKAVLDNENNPFKNVLVTQGKFKWDIQNSKGTFAAKYYCWATYLAQDPYGEAQFYIAKNLDSIAKSETNPTKKKEIKRRAIRAYYSVLTNFPKARGYEKDGKHSYTYLVGCVKSIQSLGQNSDSYPFEIVVTPKNDTIVVNSLNQVYKQE